MLLNPFAHLAVAYQQVLYEPGAYTQWPYLLVLGGASAVLLGAGYLVFDRLRDTLAEAV
jgi:ABC-type polysaccharide/polyol phosphate export permease